MSTPLPAGFASQLSYDIAAAVERQAMPQPPHQLLHCRHRRRRRATANNGLPLPCTSAGGLQLPSIIAALLVPPVSHGGHRAVRAPTPLLHHPAHHAV